MGNTLPKETQRLYAKTYQEQFNALRSAGNLDEVLNLLEEMKANGLQPTVEFFNDYLESWLKEDDFDKAFSVLKLIKEENYKPNARTFTSYFNYCVRKQRPDLYAQVMNELLLSSVSASSFAAYSKTQHAGLNLNENLDDVIYSEGINGENILNQEDGKQGLLNGMEGEYNRRSISPQKPNGYLLDPEIVVKFAPQLSSTQKLHLEKSKPQNEEEWTKFINNPTLSLYYKQMKLETRVIDMAVERYKKFTERLNEMGKGAELKPALRILLGKKKKK